MTNTANVSHEEIQGDVPFSRAKSVTGTETEGGTSEKVGGK